MAGVKGKSGRRPISIENKRIEIIDKAWEIVSDCLNSEDIGLKAKMEIAVKIAIRDMPTQPLVTVDNSKHEKYITVYLPEKGQQQRMATIPPTRDISSE